MAWFSLAKIALQAGSKIYSNRQKTKMAMSDAQLMHAEKMEQNEKLAKLRAGVSLAKADKPGITAIQVEE